MLPRWSTFPKRPKVRIWRCWGSQMWRCDTVGFLSRAVLNQPFLVDHNPLFKKTWAFNHSKHGDIGISLTVMVDEKREFKKKPSPRNRRWSSMNWESCSGCSNQDEMEWRAAGFEHFFLISAIKNSPLHWLVWEFWTATWFNEDYCYWRSQVGSAM